MRSCPRTVAEMGGFYGAATARVPPLLCDDREFLIAEQDHERIGFVDVDVDHDDPAALTIAYFIAPSFRRRGLGLAVIRSLASRHPERGIVAAVSPDNAASLSLARSAGFARTSVNEWGDVVMPRRPDGCADDSRPLGGSAT